MTNYYAIPKQYEDYVSKVESDTKARQPDKLAITEERRCWRKNSEEYQKPGIDYVKKSDYFSNRLSYYKSHDSVRDDLYTLKELRGSSDISTRKMYDWRMKCNDMIIKRDDAASRLQ